MRQIIFMLVLSAGLLAAAACGGEEATDPTATALPVLTSTPTEVQNVTFDELFSSPDQYNGRDILLEGFYFHGWETIVLSEKLEPTGRAEGHLWPQGQKIWIEGSIPEGIFDQLYQQEVLGPIERFGKLRIEGAFQYGAGYGHLGGYNAQIVPSEVVLLPRSPPSAPTATPSPLPIREWNLEDIRVDGTTVTVSLHVFAGIDVRATLDGKPADEVRPPSPNLEVVFQGVAPGQHTVEVRDVVGHSETAEVVVPSPELPRWLTDLIRKLENEPVANPPVSITQYEYKGQTVYFLPQRCCDIFSDLYDANGNIIGHPDGGITGQGDGRVPGFFELRSNERIIWEDKRTYDPGLVQVPAPIESVEVLILESFPVQYMLAVVSGLPNGCASFAGYRLERGGDTIRVEMVNWKPADPQVMCTEIYRTVETRISLGIDFESGRTYTLLVNDVTESFVAQ